MKQKSPPRESVLKKTKPPSSLAKKRKSSNTTPNSRLSNISCSKNSKKMKVPKINYITNKLSEDKDPEDVEYPEILAHSRKSPTII